MSEETVECKICGAAFKRITNTHLNSAHGITVSEYQERFPDAPIDAGDLKEQRAKNTSEALEKVYEDTDLDEVRRRDAIEQMKDPEQRELGSEIMSSIEKDEEWRENIAEARKSDDMNKREVVEENTEGGLVCVHCGKTEEEEVEEVGRKLHIHHKNGNPNDNRFENLAPLCSSCHITLHNKLRANTEEFTGNRRIIRAVSSILDELGVDQEDPDFRETPERVARMFVETCQRCFEDDEARIEDLVSTTFPEEHDEFIVIDNINAYSMCPHHLRVIEYKVDFGYIPGDEIIGLSKIPRLIKYLAKKPEVQEAYTEEIVDVFHDAVEPRACIAYVKGKHHCMTSRGVEAHNSQTTTTALRGDAHPDEGDPHIKEEFLKLTDSEARQ